MAKSDRGFASMKKNDPDKQKEIASKGGQTTASKYDMAERGRKGGQTTSQDREHMSRIGKMGGSASRKS